MLQTPYGEFSAARGRAAEAAQQLWLPQPAPRLGVGRAAAGQVAALLARHHVATVPPTWCPSTASGSMAAVTSAAIRRPYTSEICVAMAARRCTWRIQRLPSRYSAHRHECGSMRPFRAAFVALCGETAVGWRAYLTLKATARRSLGRRVAEATRMQRRLPWRHLASVRRPDPRELEPEAEFRRDRWRSARVCS
jgi:hypothetical protein